MMRLGIENVRSASVVGLGGVGGNPRNRMFTDVYRY